MNINKRIKVWRIFLLIVLLILFIISQSKGDEIKQTINAEEILAKIKNREPISYSSAVIDGDIFMEDEFIDSPISITDSEINSDIYFNNCVFNDTVCFENTEFRGIASFDGSKFNDHANFGDAIFHMPVIFMEAEFINSASFWNSRFNGSTTFKRTIFSKKVDFHRSKFGDIAIFNLVFFNGDEINFENCNFNGVADFRQSRFGGDVNFVGAFFKEGADFTGSRFNLSINFLGSKFEKSLYFRKIKFNILNMDWSSIHNELVSDEPGYILLIKNFKDLGQFEDADNCYYEYREMKRNNRPLDVEKIFDSIAWITCGYGVRWFQPLFSGFFAVIAFGIYFEIYHVFKITNVLVERGAKSLNLIIYDLWMSIKKSLLFSTMTLLSLPSDWCPYGKEEYSKFIKFHLCAAILERIIGWGLMLLLIGTLSRLMVRY